MKDKLTIATKWLLDFMFYAGIVTILILPLLIRWYGVYDPHFITYRWPLYALYGVSGILAVLVIYELRRMFGTVLAEDCFIRENVISLRRMGTYSFCIAAVSAVRIMLYLTTAILVIILVFVIAGLFSKVLSQVFETAVKYKEENDLTI